MSESVNCQCIKFTDDEGHTGKEPVYMTRFAACADVALPTAAVIPAHAVCKVDLLIGFDIPCDKKIIMYPRSSLLIKKGLMQPVSIIDSDYSGQHVHVPFYNITDHDVVLEENERVAQIECTPMYDTVNWTRKAVDRKGGFGSTGK